MPSCLGMEQEPSPSKAYTMVPPAPPPSPANFTNSQANGLSFKIEAGTSVNSDFSSWKANVSKFH
uniref:Uncharacterized protein n=1 Tax=Jaculus jaculus TaxID=51337 RepID=A0A8C5JUL0_JACJA